MCNILLYSVLLFPVLLLLNDIYLKNKQIYINLDIFIVHSHCAWRIKNISVHVQKWYAWKFCMAILISLVIKSIKHGGHGFIFKISKVVQRN